MPLFNEATVLAAGLWGDYYKMGQGPDSDNIGLRVHRVGGDDPQTCKIFFYFLGTVKKIPKAFCEMREF